MQNRKSYTVEEALSRMQAYCAYQERCHKEVRQKLREMNMIPMAQDHIMAKLIEENFLNETRFAKAFARGKFRFKYWGKYRIERELKARDINAYNIKEAFKEISNSDYNTHFHKIADKRLKQLESETNLMKKKQKFISYLQYRGWESHLIFEKWNDEHPY